MKWFKGWFLVDFVELCELCPKYNVWMINNGKTNSTMNKCLNGMNEIGSRPQVLRWTWMKSFKSSILHELAFIFSYDKTKRGIGILTWFVPIRTFDIRGSNEPKEETSSSKKSPNNLSDLESSNIDMIFCPMQSLLIEGWGELGDDSYEVSISKSFTKLSLPSSFILTKK